MQDHVHRHGQSHLECDDVYKNMKRDIARFDERLSGRQRVWYASREQKSTGLMKDENNGAIMTEFVGVRAKMYAVRVDGKKDIKKVKGVKNNVVARTITFDDYTRCLNKEIEMTRHQSCIWSKLHDIRIENRSESIRWQTIRRTELDGNVTVGIGYLCNICYYYVLLIIIYTFFTFIQVLLLTCFYVIAFIISITIIILSYNTYHKFLTFMFLNIYILLVFQFNILCIPYFFLSFMHITIMYYYYFNLHVMQVFLHLYKYYYYYVLCSFIYYITIIFSFHVSYIYICIFQNEDGKDNKKKYVYIDV